ncbi:hypothetical protein IF1G_05558 [Cordyceps javanica]|uniref:Uncharacterized protein n=1 Tax=Cordyceps javanica TaxID=43265 RepID=A0A545V1Z0_9HYPO|nr:hypothetical protein IF1G_05558 [Cordyceps javanica]
MQASTDGARNSPLSLITWTNRRRLHFVAALLVFPSTPLPAQPCPYPPDDSFRSGFPSTRRLLLVLFDLLPRARHPTARFPPPFGPRVSNLTFWVASRAVL